MLKVIPEVKIEKLCVQKQQWGCSIYQMLLNDWGLYRIVFFKSEQPDADLDNDGDLDVVMSNINDKAFIYENKAKAKRKNRCSLPISKTHRRIL